MTAAGQQSFTASYDSATKIITAVVFAILTIVFIATRSPIVVGLGAALIVGSYAYSPRAYVIAGRSLLVKRLIGTVRIPLDNVREVRPAAADDFKGCVRLWGNGGLYGYYGLFSTSKLGKSTWYLTNRKNSVVVATAEKTFLVSPDEVPAFLAAIRGAVPVPETPAGPYAGVTESRGSRVPIPVWIGAAIGIVVAAVVAAAFMYAPGPPNFTLTPNSLAIHDRFYPATVNAADVDVANVRIVNIRTDPSWRPKARTNGFSNAHYHSGWFRVAGGEKARMYWADGTTLVLLPPLREGVPVLLQVNDPERFVADVRREWSREH